MDLEKFQEIRIKELQLYKLFPTFDKNLLAEILADNDYDVEQTVNVLADLNSHERSSHSPFLCKEQPNKGDTEANPNPFPIDFLPVDVKLGIFSFLSDKDLLACALVNKSWKKLSENTYLWCKQAAAKGLKYNAQTLKSLYASNVSMKRWFYAELRWLKPRTRKCDQVYYAGNHIHALQFDDEKLICAGPGVNQYAEVWKGTKTVLVGHTKSIHDLELYNDTVVTCSSDKTLRIWDLSDIERSQGTISTDRVLEGHEDRVNCVKMCKFPSSGRIISGASNKSIRIWDAKGADGSVLIDEIRIQGVAGAFTLGSSVFSLQYTMHLLVAGTYNNQLMISKQHPEEYVRERKWFN